jgi:hypothetical protein
MAAQAYYDGPDATDIGSMWEEALIKYNEECGINIRGMDFVGRQNMTFIMSEQDRQMSRFNEFRHDKSKLDRFRSRLAANSAIIKSVAANVSNAASAAFPPSAVILTAFNYVMGAAKAVSDDFNTIVAFFDIMDAFLRRVSLLEERMPGEQQFKRFLMNVFSALLTMCAIATKIQAKGRLRQWAKALIDGTDPKLKAAYDTVHMHLERFESAVMIMTLRETIDSGSKLDAVGRDLKVIQAGVEQNLQIGQQNLAVSQQSYIIGMETSGYAKDSAMTGHEILDLQEDTRVEVVGRLKELKRISQKSARETSTAEPQLDAGARKATAFLHLEKSLDWKLDNEGGYPKFLFMGVLGERQRSKY